jgi:hypothetical protein
MTIPVSDPPMLAYGMIGAPRRSASWMKAFPGPEDHTVALGEAPQASYSPPGPITR